MCFLLKLLCVVKDVDFIIWVCEVVEGIFVDDFDFFGYVGLWEVIGWWVSDEDCVVFVKN